MPGVTWIRYLKAPFGQFTDSYMELKLPDLYQFTFCGSKLDIPDSNKKGPDHRSGPSKSYEN
ncbi:MAG: hypothetical protein DWQ02_24085 [Bacteroidetes bacterium]|nr:MAG: hypothetical protein DWQ02_24085 [Bacteroidota bacterium]